MGVNDTYFTGGAVLTRGGGFSFSGTRGAGSTTVLTNATLITPERASALAALEGGSRYSLEVRVSLDGPTAASNDPIRGEGSFDATMAGVEALARAGLHPIVTVARTWSDEEDLAVRGEFRRFLGERGLARARVKVLPLFLLGREVERTRGYVEEERLTEEHLRGHDPWLLQCSTSRCHGRRHGRPLLSRPDARIGVTLRAIDPSVSAAHGACHTWADGGPCRTDPAAKRRCLRGRDRRVGGVYSTHAALQAGARGERRRGRRVFLPG